VTRDSMLTGGSYRVGRRVYAKTGAPAKTRKQIGSDTGATVIRIFTIERTAVCTGFISNGSREVRRCESCAAVCSRDSALLSHQTSRLPTTPPDT
jgi:hypothetical protein